MLKLLRPSLLLIVVFILGGAVWKASAPTFCPALSQNAQIFVLTGDARRIPFGLRKIRGFPMRHLYIIGAGAPDLSDIIPERFMPQITSETASTSTHENAIAIKNITSARGITDLVLITTEDHILRATLLLHRQIPNAHITACPVPLRGMPAPHRAVRWGLEYIKYLGSLIGVEGKK